MEFLLRGLLPRLFPNSAVDFRYVPHQGKSELLRSIRKKLRAWREPGVRFVVLCDNDMEDCRKLKKKLQEQCGQRSNVLIRIVCQELEAWYLGEQEAIESAYGAKLGSLSKKSKFRDIDELAKPSKELEQLVPQFSKLQGARLLAKHLTRERNRSPSFRAFIDGLGTVIQGGSRYP